VFSEALGKGETDLFNDGHGVLKDGRVREAQDEEADPVQFFGPPFVLNGSIFLVMDAAIHLDDKESCRAAEIDDEPSNHMLPAKWDTELVATQIRPEVDLGRRLSLPELTSRLMHRSTDWSRRLRFQRLNSWCHDDSGWVTETRSPPLQPQVRST